MTLRQYLHMLIDIAKEKPELLDKPVIYSKDDEGNDFNKVVFAPNTGVYNDKTRDYTPSQETKVKANCVCIN